MDLLTWTRKGKDSNIYYIYTYIYIDWYVTQKSKSGEFVGTFCYCYCYLLLLLLLSLFVCVLPLQTVCCCYDKKNRLLEHNTYLTLPYSPFFYRTLTRSTGIHHRFIVWFLETNDYSGRRKSPPSEQISNLPENSLESITIQIQFSKYSRRALEKTFTLVVVVVVVVVIIRKQREPNQTEIYQSSRRKFTFYDQNFTPIRRRRRRRKKTKNNNINIKTMTHHRMGFTPSTSSSSSTTTTKPSAITTKKSLQRACLGGMVITPCEKCTIRTYVSLLSLHPIPSHPA